MQSQALVNKILLDVGDTKLNNLISFLAGVTLLALLAQIAIPLPWTPVPVTGQTFGVTLIALLWGKKRAFAIVSAYLIVGVVGLPVFAASTMGVATSGYLVGMLFSSIVVGHFSDLGWSSSFKKAWFAGFLGSCVTFAFGLTVLSFFVPFEALLISGLLPFLPGDLVKTVTAAFIANKSNKFMNS